MEASTDRSTVNLVVLLLGLAVIVGLTGLIWLIHDGTSAALLVVVSTPVATFGGALGAMLSSTRSVNTEGLAKLAESDAAQKLKADLDGLDNSGDYGDDELV